MLKNYFWKRITNSEIKLPTFTTAANTKKQSQQYQPWINRISSPQPIGSSLFCMSCLPCLYFDFFPFFLACLPFLDTVFSSQCCSLVLAWLPLMESPVIPKSTPLCSNCSASSQFQLGFPWFRRLTYTSLLHLSLISESLVHLYWFWFGNIDRPPCPPYTTTTLLSMSPSWLTLAQLSQLGLAELSTFLSLLDTFSLQQLESIPLYSLVSLGLLS